MKVVAGLLPAPVIAGLLPAPDPDRDSGNCEQQQGSKPVLLLLEHMEDERVFEDSLAA